MSKPNTQIPLSDPGASYFAYRKEIDTAVGAALANRSYILGQEVKLFEEEFAAWNGSRFAVGVANGTDAIEIALRAAGIGRGDLVLTVSHTAVATVCAIERAGATPVLMDVDPDTFCMTSALLEKALAALKSRGMSPKAIIPVHIYGNMADVEAIGELAKANNALLIEDCAQSHGSTRGAKRAGASGVMGTFSFYPTKNLGAFGDGGMVVTDSPELNARLRSSREYGWTQRYVSTHFGINSRLDELQAAILRVKLPKLNHENETRRARAEQYRKGLGALDVALPSPAPGVTHTYHLYVVRTPRRDQLAAYLKERGIGTGIHYPVPIHQQPAFTNALLAIPGIGLPTTELLSRHILSLPMYPQLPESDVERVCAAISDFFRG